jgi:hypothetical protein
MDYPRSTLAIGAQARFSASIPAGCYAELAQCLTRRPDQWNHVDPAALEHLVAEIFRQNFAPCDVEHVGRSSDGGKDIVYVSAESERWLIQVKGHRNPSRAEPVTTIRLLVGTLVHDNVPRGIVVTTSNAFSRDAYEAVRQYDARGYRIRLIDRGLLRELIGPLVPRRPWEALLGRPDFRQLGNEILPHSEAVLVPDQLELGE